MAIFTHFPHFHKAKLQRYSPCICVSILIICSWAACLLLAAQTREHIKPKVTHFMYYIQFLPLDQLSGPVLQPVTTSQICYHIISSQFEIFQDMKVSQSITLNVPRYQRKHKETNLSHFYSHYVNYMACDFNKAYLFMGLAFIQAATEGFAE